MLNHDCCGGVQESYASRAHSSGPLLFDFNPFFLPEKSDKGS